MAKILVLFVTTAEVTDTKRKMWKADITLTAVYFPGFQMRDNSRKAKIRITPFIAELFILHRRKVVFLSD